MAEKSCPICGKSFNTELSQKYCSSICTKEGQKRIRKEWEERTGYKEKKRQWTKEYRAKQKEVTQRIIEKEDEERAEARKRQDEIMMQEGQAELEAAAANGDIDAQMELALEQDDMRTYYTLYRESIMKNDDEFNVKDRHGRHIIAGVDVYDPDFIEKAIARENQDN